MAITAVSNFAADVAHRNLRRTNAGLSLTLAKLSAGRRVLAAKDDAAALAIGSRLGAEAAGLSQAQVNAGQGAAMLRVADGGLARIGDILVRMKSLAVQAGSGQLSADERAALDVEFRALASEVDRIATDTDFAGTELLDGSTPSVSFKVGTGTNPASDEAAVSLPDGSAAALALAGADISSKSGADAASVVVSAALDQILTARARLGADENRLGFAAANIATTAENTGAARSALLDLDVAAETGRLATRRTLFQAGVAMLRQANETPQSLLRLVA